ncbi:hypothetical protein CNR22_04905 [Sphingobacteriaceae bacterium]|nr:hypothetical protein CNR22_04905 [Sphingobacteriaceae bacterium]
MHVRQLCFYCLLFIFSFSHYSQTKGYLLEKSFDFKMPFTITQFSTRDGLPQSQILDIVPKSNGNLIIATALGILEYNGTEFKPFIKDDAYKAQLYTKVLWNNKYARLFARGVDGHPYLLYPEYRLLNHFRAFCISGDSMFCMNESGEIYSADLGKLQFKKIASTEIKNAESLFYDKNFFLAGTKEGLMKYKCNSKQSFAIGSGDYRYFKKSPYDSCIYSLGDKVIYKISDSSSKIVFSVPKKNIFANCSQFDFIGRNEFYVATTRGLYAVTTGYTDVYKRINALPSVFFQAIYYNSNEDCLFIGTGEKGLIKLHFKNCYTYYTDQGFDENTSLCSIISTKSGETLLANPSGIIYKLAIDTVFPKIKIRPHISSLAEIDGCLYIGTWKNGVILAKNGKRFDSICAPKQLRSGAVHAIFKDRKGTIWIGTSNGAACGASSKSIKPVLTDVVKKVIITFYQLKNGNLCLGGNEGVYILDSTYKCIAHLGKKEGILGKEVRCFYEDAEGRLWIGTYGGGLYCYYKEHLTSVNKMANARLNDNVFCLAKDDSGYLYVTSNYGLWRIKEKDLADFYEGKLKYLVPFHYDEEAGILNTEFNGGFQNNYLKSKSNHFYFPSLQGVVIVVPETPSKRNLLPVINKVLINDTAYDSSEHRFERETFSVEFQFSTTSFLGKYNVYYQYKLDGEHSTNWSSLSKETSVTYKLIPPGKYTFSVRVVDAFNDPFPRVSTYRFEIKPHFYERLWFRISSFLFFIAITFITVRYRFQNYRRKAEERERTQRQMAELKLQAIQAQMNPHFVFNSLNSIKYYLSINDQKNADLYIDHFSKLLRNFLESGSKSFITIENEIQIITSYLELEKQRMNPSFDFSISVTENVESMLIPTHLIQPFVENAIKHGINHSSKKCKIDIAMVLENNSIICTIEDDGIGRERSLEINKNRPGRHTSKGLEIVSEKIRIIKDIYGIHVKLTTHDKHVGSLKETGTKVTLIIPLKENENTHS